MRNPSFFIVALRHVKNRQTLQGLNGHATFEKLFLGNISAAVSIWLDHQSFLQCWQIWHPRHFASLSFCTKKEKTSNRFFNIPTCNWNRRFFSIAVTVHIINKQRNQTGIIDHSKLNCGQSQTARKFSPDYKALGRKSLTPSDGGLLVAVLLIPFICHVHSHQNLWFSHISSTVARRYSNSTSLLQLNV